MDRQEMMRRTKQFAHRVIKLVAALPRNRVADVLGNQVLRSGTAIGAVYREAVHASSRRHFATILETAQREADETSYWLDLIADPELVKPGRLSALRKECDELISILTASVRTTKRNTPQKPTRRSSIINHQS